MTRQELINNVKEHIEVLCTNAIDTFKEVYGSESLLDDNFGIVSETVELKTIANNELNNIHSIELLEAMCEALNKRANAISTKIFNLVNSFIGGEGNE